MSLLQAISGVLRPILAARFLSYRHVTALGPVRLNGLPYVRVHPGSEMSIGRHVVISSTLKSNRLEARGRTILRTITNHALLDIGDHVGMTSTTISCAASITIGARTLLGSGVLITDSDHHPLETSPNAPRRFAPLPAPKNHHSITIGSDVFIGARTLIMKGTTIGDGSVIGAGSVVRGAIPAYCIAAGNPCVVVGFMDGASELPERNDEQP